MLSGLLVAACSGTHGILPSQPSNGNDASHRLRKHACLPGWTGTGGFPVTIMNKSGLPSPNLYLLTNGNADYVGPSASATQAPLPQATATVPPFPLAQACNPFMLPPSASARLYVAYGNLGINAQDATPLGIPSDPNGAYGILFDYFEYSTSGSTVNMDTSQVDAIGLPFYGQVWTAAKPGTVPQYQFGFKDYATIVSLMGKSNAYASLIVRGKVGSASNTVLRIVSPDDAVTKSWGSYSPGTFATALTTSYNAFLKTAETYYEGFAPSKTAYGKIQFIPYQLNYGTPPPYPTSAPDSPACNEPNGGSGGSWPCPVYNAYYDSSGFEFALVTPQPSPGSPATPYPFPAKVTIPASDLTVSSVFANQPPAPIAFPTDAPASANCNWTTSACEQWQHVRSGVTAYLWKQMAVDLNRGVLRETGYHGVLPTCMSGYGSTPCIGKNYYPITNSNLYSRILHYHAVNSTNPAAGVPGSAYGFPFDDLFHQSTDVNTTGPVTKFVLTIEPVP